jgi:hypothetical protein
LIGQRDTARAYTASTLGNGAPPGNVAPPAGPLNPSQDGGRPRRAALRQSATAPAEVPAGQPAPGVPAGAPAPAEQPTNGSHP